MTYNKEDKINKTIEKIEKEIKKELNAIDKIYIYLDDMKQLNNKVVNKNVLIRRIEDKKINCYLTIANRWNYEGKQSQHITLSLNRCGSEGYNIENYNDCEILDYYTKPGQTITTQEAKNKKERLNFEELEKILFEEIDRRNSKIKKLSNLKDNNKLENIINKFDEAVQIIKDIQETDICTNTGYILDDLIYKRDSYIY